MAKLNSLEDLYLEELKDIYSAENQLTKALGTMAKNADAPELQECFRQHLDQTKQHVDRLEQIFSDLDASPRGKKCKAMEGLIAEGKELLEEDADPSVLDAGLIAIAQKVEHYEIAGYGTLRTYAGLLGYEDAERLLEQTLKEEKETDQKLTKVAESLNVEAEEAAEEED